MASNFNYTQLPVSDEWLNENVDANVNTDSDNCHEKGPLYLLSGCRPGHAIVPECEVFLNGEAGPDLKLKDCEKNPGHGDFIPVKDFTANHLPLEMRTEETMCKIRMIVDRTVLIRVKYTSHKRPNTYRDSKTPYPFRQFKGSRRAVRTGTGFINRKISFKPEFGDCPCYECKESGIRQNKYWVYHVTTATHVVFDDFEAEGTIVKCFYDSEEDLDEAVILYGVEVFNLQTKEEMFLSDVCDRLICVTHDEKSAQRISSRIGDFPFNKAFIAVQTQGIIVSHPHGCSKKISVGKVLHRTIPLQSEQSTGKRYDFPKNTFCYSPSDIPGEKITNHYLETTAGAKFYLWFRDLCSGRTVYYHEGATFTLPDDAEYFMRFPGDQKWFSFPPGTTFHSGDGSAIRISDNALFESLHFKKYLCIYGESILAYDSPTCPGSSGALVSSFWDHSHVLPMLPYFVHSGCGMKEQCFCCDKKVPCNWSCVSNQHIHICGNFK